MSDNSEQADTTSILGWVVVSTVALLLVALAFMPGLVLLAGPLYGDSGHAAVLLFVSPIAALAGGGLLILRERHAGGLVAALAGIGMLVGWWGPIGWLLGPLLLFAGAAGLALGFVSFAVAVVLPMIMYAGTMEVFGPASARMELAKTEKRLSEIQGTLRWQEESPGLKVERERLKALVETKRNRAGVALAIASLVGGVVSLGIAAIVRRRAPAIGKGLIYGGGLCVLQGALVLVGVI